MTSSGIKQRHRKIEGKAAASGKDKYLEVKHGVAV